MESRGHRPICQRLHVAGANSSGASKNLLHKRGASRDTLKCSASEALNFMVALRAYLILFVFPTCTDALRRSLLSMACPGRSHCKAAGRGLCCTLGASAAHRGTAGTRQSMLGDRMVDPQMPPSSSSPATIIEARFPAIMFRT